MVLEAWGEGTGTYVGILTLRPSKLGHNEAPTTSLMGRGFGQIEARVKDEEEADDRLV